MGKNAVEVFILELGVVIVLIGFLGAPALYVYIMLHSTQRMADLVCYSLPVLVLLVAVSMRGGLSHSPIPVRRENLMAKKNRLIKILSHPMMYEVEFRTDIVNGGLLGRAD